MKCPVCGSKTTVLETREMHDNTVSRRRRTCDRCDTRFNTFEMFEDLWASVRRHAPAHAAGVNKRRALYIRNERIKQRLLAGEKHASIAVDYGLSDNMVSTIARRLGVPSKRMRCPVR